MSCDLKTKPKKKCSNRSTMWIPHIYYALIAVVTHFCCSHTLDAQSTSMQTWTHFISFHFTSIGFLMFTKWNIECFFLNRFFCQVFLEEQKNCRMRIATIELLCIICFDLADQRSGLIGSTMWSMPLDSENAARNKSERERERKTINWYKNTNQTQFDAISKWNPFKSERKS